MNTYIRNISAPILDNNQCTNEREYKSFVPDKDPYDVSVDDEKFSLKYYYDNYPFAFIGALLSILLLTIIILYFKFS